MSDILRAALWMIGTITSFCVMAIAGREVAGSLDTFETMMYRSVVGVIIMLGVLTILRKWPEVTSRQLGLHAARNVAHFTGQNLWFYAIPLIPLAQVFALEFTSPVWVILLAPIFLGERLTQTRLIAGALGFTGILIVARPGVSEVNIGTLAAAASAIFFALTAIATSRLTRRQTTACILFYLTIMQLGLGILCAGFDGDVAAPDSATLHWLILIGCAGLMAHFCLTQALNLAPAAVVMPMDFVRLPVIAILGMLVYAERIEIWVFIGAACIFAGNYINILSQARADRDRS